MATRASHEPLPIARAASLKHSASCLRSWGDQLFWIEGRPELDGDRVVLSAREGGVPQIVSPPGVSLSSRVHEYGGGALCILDRSTGPVIVGVRAHDQAIISFHPHDPEVTEVVGGSRQTALGDLSPGPGESILAVRERHHEGEVHRDIVRIDLAGGGILPLVSGRDFYSDPRTGEGDRIVWCAWDHPSMPWEGSEVWTAQLRTIEDRVEVCEVTHVAGSPTQPASSPVILADGSLALIGAAEDRAELGRWSGVSGLAPLGRGEGEVGQPLWILGTTSVARVAGTDELACVYRSRGRSMAARPVGEGLEAMHGLPGSVAEVVSTATGVGILGVGDEELGFVAWWTRSGGVTKVALGPSVPGPVSTAEPVEVQCEDGRVEDCVALVEGLAAQGRVDATRAAIRGSSAGGLTALLGLTTGAFVGAVSWYGVADLVTLAQSTHDFESRYLDRLIGPIPEALAVYEERSPVHRAHEMAGAALLLQGLEDPVVPPAQAESMARALRENGHHVELIEFPGESHGFRRLETLVTAFAAEVAFYERHLAGAGVAGSIDSQ